MCGTGVDYHHVPRRQVIFVAINLDLHDPFDNDIDLSTLLVDMTFLRAILIEDSNFGVWHHQYGTLFTFQRWHPLNHRCFNLPVRIKVRDYILSVATCTCCKSRVAFGSCQIRTLPRCPRFASWIWTLTWADSDPMLCALRHRHGPQSWHSLCTMGCAPRASRSGPSIRL